MFIYFPPPHYNICYTNVRISVCFIHWYIQDTNGLRHMLNEQKNKGLPSNTRTRMKAHFDTLRGIFYRDIKGSLFLYFTKGLGVTQSMVHPPTSRTMCIDIPELSDPRSLALPHFSLGPGSNKPLCKPYSAPHHPAQTESATTSTGALNSVRQ